MSSAIASSALSRPDGSAMLQGGAEHDRTIHLSGAIEHSVRARSLAGTTRGRAMLCCAIQRSRTDFACRGSSRSTYRLYWEAIKVLVLRGVHSDLLSFDLAAEMRKRNRFASLFQFDDCGHVPPLMAPEQIEVVTRFLLDDTRPGLGER
jgi:pimeloyl-ACP methyl ester carboxylesterase